MNSQKIAEELMQILQSNGVQIRKEPLGGSGGGLCFFKGEKIFYFDSQSSCFDIAAACAGAVSKVVDIEKIYLKPEVRDFVEKYSDSTGQKENIW